MTKLEHALRLAELGFWVFPIVKGKKAPPVMTGWQERATRDATIFELWFKDADYNIGIFTSLFRENEALLVVDVDNKGAKRGDEELLRLELEGRELPQTFTQRTPTGGRHLVYSVVSPVRQGANVLGPGLDIRSRGGFIVGCGSRVEAGEYTADDHAIVPAPEWLVEACGVARADSDVSVQSEVGSVDADAAIERARHYLRNEAPLAVEGEGGDETTYKVAARLKDLGIASPNQAAILLWEEWNDRCSPPWTDGQLNLKVLNAYRYGRDPVGVAAPEAVFDVVVSEKPPQTSDEKLHPFDKLNREYAFVLAGGGDHILWETKDSSGNNTLVHLATSAFHNKHAAWEMTFGKKTSPITKEWMRSDRRRSYDGICFSPEQAHDPRFYNLWRGFSVAPAATGSTHDAVDALLTHTRDNVCKGDAALCGWLMAYFAHLVQRPWEKPLTALVFRGGKGVGKNALIERIGGLLGSHFLVTSDRRYLVGNFNGHLENLLLFALDEAFWSGDKQAEGQLKNLITGKEHVIEHKGKEIYTVANRTRVAIIGNEDWLVPASHDERRFAVFDVGDGRKQDRRYFQDMREGLERGGYSVLLRYLLDYDLSTVDINEAPRTEALLDQKHASLELVEQWWHDCLHSGGIVSGDFTDGFGSVVECSRLRDAFTRYARGRNARGRLPDDKSFGRTLKKVCGGVVATKQRIGGVPTNIYKLPDLPAARALWDAFIGHSVAWPTE